MKNTNSANSHSPANAGECKITISENQVIYKDTKQTLLECLEKENVEVHYHCRDGYCGACRVTLNKGKINYFNGEPLAYMRPNEILTCCCKPITDIDISID